MAILNNSNAISTAGGYDINNSLRIRQSASAYLSRAPSSSGSQTTWTLSAWVKRGKLSALQTLFAEYNANNDAGYSTIYFAANDTLHFTGFYTVYFQTTQVFRDPSAWYHIVLAVDTTQATSTNRIKLYVNGAQVTAFGTTNYPAQNATFSINNTGTHYFGFDGFGSSGYLDGYISEVNFVNAQQLTPSSFGETDTTTGSWKPKAYTSTYGTNGFYLKFSDIATTSGSNAGLGKDFSGNANYWNTNNISVTAGTTYDAMKDSPTLTSATVSNYAVMNPVGIIKTTSASLATFAGANLNVSGGAAWFYAYSSIAIPIGSGKYYAEFTINTSGGSDYIAVGINPVVGSFGATAHSSSEGGVWYSNNATKWLGNTNSSYGASYTANDIIGVAVDSGASTITFYKNNTSQGSISFNSNLTSNTLALLGVDMYNSSISANFGQRPFSYTPPTGFVALNTYNLPDSTIKKGNTVMDATTYTGTGASLSVTNTSAFKPDFVWVKGRSGATDHALYDSVRGTTKQLESNTADNETTEATGLTAFGTGGFTVGALAQINTNTATYVGWQWQAGQGSTSSGTGTGGITSVTQSVNTTAGFSIVTYTGSGTTGTVTHGLGVAPSWIIIKSRSAVDTWRVYHASLGNTKYINLNDTSAAGTASTVWNNTSPTSSVFTLGTESSVNGSGRTQVAYCWAEIAGFSKFSSYTGNGSSDGVFVYTGFRPKYVMIKRTDAVNSWYVYDSQRNTYNTSKLVIFAESSSAEATSTTSDIDLLSNGFKIRGADSGINASGGSYIIACFAENPFKNSNAR